LTPERLEGQIRGGMSEMSEQFLPVHHRTKLLIHFWRSAARPSGR